MPRFIFKAIDIGGEVTRGVMLAPDATTVGHKLQQVGKTPLSIRRSWLVVLLLATSYSVITKRQKIGFHEIINFTDELATMLRAGQDLDRALSYVLEAAKTQRASLVIEKIRSSVRNGSSLAQALTEQSDSFSALYIGLIQSAELGGTLADTLGHLALLLERQQNLANEIKLAMIYPVVLLVAALMSLVLMATQVLPQFVLLFDQSGARLPEAARALLSAVELGNQWGAHILILCFLIFYSLRLWLRRRAPRLMAERLLLDLPVLGPLMREVQAARLSRALGVLLVNGVPMQKSLDLVIAIFDGRVLGFLVRSASLNVRSGMALSSALVVHNILPKRTIELFRLGEETGQLGKMALRAADIHEAQAKLAMQRLMKLLVPSITIALGVVVGGIIATLLSAMLSLNDLAR